MPVLSDDNLHLCRYHSDQVNAAVPIAFRIAHIIFLGNKLVAFCGIPPRLAFLVIPAPRFVLPYSLTFSAMRIDYNVNLALVKQALGHRSISSTMQYIGTSDLQAAEAVGAALMATF